jgi:cobalt-zinc-cadmium efflux system membrane fusion protein
MKTNTIIYLFALISLSLSACFGNQEDAIEIEMATAEESETILSDQQFQSSEMTLTQLEAKTFPNVVKANGRIYLAPENQIAINSYFSGTVKRIQLLPGEKVTKGQELFSLEGPEILNIQQNYLETKAQLAYSKGDYERQLALSQDNVNSQKDFKKAESEYFTLKVRLESLAKKLALLNINPTTLSAENIQSAISIRTPMDAYVTKVNISRGAHLSADETALELVNSENVLINLNIFEKDLQSVEIGQEISFRTLNMQDKSYSAKVLLVNRFINPENGSLEIIGEISKSEQSKNLSAGMYIEAEIYSPADTLLALPEDAIVEMDGAFYVLRLISQEKGQFSFAKTEVKIGKKGKAYVAIMNSDEFDPNTKFLAKGAFNLILE